MVQGDHRFMAVRQGGPSTVEHIGNGATPLSPKHLESRLLEELIPARHKLEYTDMEHKYYRQGPTDGPTEGKPRR